MRRNLGAIICAVSLFFSCQSEGEKTTLKVMKPAINCAHRGASGHAPENTLIAMTKAIEMGAAMSEVDVQQTADNRLVLFHDDELERTSNGEGNLYEKTYEELRNLDAGRWYGEEFAGEKIATLEEVIAHVRGKMKLNVEVKLHGNENNVEQLVVDLIRRENFGDQCVVTSFGHQEAENIKKLAPELTVGYIFGRDGFHEGVFSGPVDLLSANYRLVDQAFMEKARAAGKEVHVWTVNDKETMRKMMRVGVDAILTDYPDRLADVLAEIEE